MFICFNQCLVKCRNLQRFSKNVFLLKCHKFTHLCIHYAAAINNKHLIKIPHSSIIQAYSSPSSTTFSPHLNTSSLNLHFCLLLKKQQCLQISRSSFCLRRKNCSINKSLKRFPSLPHAFHIWTAWKTLCDVRIYISSIFDPFCMRFTYTFLSWQYNGMKITDTKLKAPKQPK